MTDLNVLFTSAGRRVALIRLFGAVLDELGIGGRRYTSDARPDAPAHWAGDEAVHSPLVNDPGYVDWLIDFCQAREIRLVVPLIDPELPLLSAQRDRMLGSGIVPLVSTNEVIELALDKRITASYFRSIGVNTPRVYSEEELSDPEKLRFPLIIKPASGSGGIGVERIPDPESLLFYVQRTVDPVVQQHIAGTEYTVDVLADEQGQPVAVVPRRRIAVRGGEVSKGETIKHHSIMEVSAEIVRRLPGAFGPITLQCIENEKGEIYFIEVNPRFGGGYPLSAAAGANFPRWIIEHVLGKNPQMAFDGWSENVVMLRFDDAYFVSRATLIEEL